MLAIIFSPYLWYVRDIDVPIIICLTTLLPSITVSLLSGSIMRKTFDHDIEMLLFYGSVLLEQSYHSFGGLFSISTILSPGL